MNRLMRFLWRVPEHPLLMVEGKQGWAYVAETRSGGPYLKKFHRIVEWKSGLRSHELKALAERIASGKASDDDRTLFGEVQSYLLRIHNLNLVLKTENRPTP